MSSKYIYLMQPILTQEQFNLLRKAKIIGFDYKMSKGNQYYFNVKRLVEMFSEREEGWCSCEDSEWFWEEYDTFTLDHEFKRRVKEKICQDCHKPKHGELVTITEKEESP